jgi:hypothetical protein
MHHPQDKHSDPAFAHDVVEEVALAAVTVSGPDERLEKPAPDLWEGWRSTIRGYLREIEHFDLVAKLETGGSPGGRLGIVEGLATRGLPDDTTVARPVQARDEAPKSLGGLSSQVAGIDFGHSGNQKGSLER